MNARIGVNRTERYRLVTDYTVTLIAPDGTDTPVVREYEVTALTAADALAVARGQATTADRLALAIGKSVVTAKHEPE